MVTLQFSNHASKVDIMVPKKGNYKGSRVITNLYGNRIGKSLSNRKSNTKLDTITVETIVAGSYTDCSIMVGDEPIRLREFVDMPFINHIRTIDFIANMIGAEKIEPKYRWMGPNHYEVGFDGDDIVTGMKVPRYFLPEGLDGIFKGTIRSDQEKTVLEYGRKKKVLSKGKEILNRHTHALMNLERRAMEIVSGHEIDDEDFEENNKVGLFHVGYWNSCQKDMTDSASRIMEIILKASPNATPVLMGSLARADDKIPADIDIVLLVDDSEKKILDADRYWTEEREKQSNLKRYNKSDITNGLSQELGISDALVALSKERGVQSYRSYDCISSLTFGEHASSLDLNSVFLLDLRDAARLEALMKRKITPGYYRDIFRDGLLLERDKLTPAKERFRKEANLTERLFAKAQEEKWPNHMNDPRIFKVNSYI